MLLLETAFAPVLVYAFVGEKPNAQTACSRTCRNMPEHAQKRPIITETLQKTHEHSRTRTKML